MTPRIAASIDLNQNEIVNGLRGLGMTVQILSATGKGCPDILVGHIKSNILLEIKSEGGRLTSHQVLWHDAWHGQVAVVRSLDEAIAEINRVIKGR